MMTTTNKMPAKQGLLILVLAAVLSVGLFVFLRKDQQKSYRSVVFSSSAGWGYDILVNEQLLIRQETIPVQTGHRGFATAKQAQFASQLIINKMKNGQSPTLTSFDLHRINNGTAP